MTASTLVFVVSLPFDTYYTRWTEPRDGAPAYMALLVGWLGVIGGIPAWLANPALFTTWFLLLRRERRAIAFGAGAVFFAGTFLSQKEMPLNEAGTTAAIVSYGAGYWLWLLSTAMAFAAALSIPKEPVAPHEPSS